MPAQPGNLLFVDSEPMEFVAAKAEAAPGSWTIEPLLHAGRKTITLSALPGIDPSAFPWKSPGSASC